MFSQLTYRLLSIFSKSRSYKHIPKHSLIEISLLPHIYRRNYYSLTLPTSITQTTTLKSFQNISPVNLPLFYIIKRPISSLDTPKEIEQAERWLKKFTK